VRKHRKKEEKKVEPAPKMAVRVEKMELKPCKPYQKTNCIKVDEGEHDEAPSKQERVSKDEKED